MAFGGNKNSGGTKLNPGSTSPDLYKAISHSNNNINNNGQAYRNNSNNIYNQGVQNQINLQDVVRANAQMNNTSNFGQKPQTQKQPSLFKKEIAAFMCIMALIVAEFIAGAIAKRLLAHSEEIMDAGSRLGNFAQSEIGGLGSTDYTQGFDKWMSLYVSGLPVIAIVTGVIGGVYMILILPASYNLKNNNTNQQSISNNTTGYTIEYGGSKDSATDIQDPHSYWGT